MSKQTHAIGIAFGMGALMGGLRARRNSHDGDIDPSWINGERTVAVRRDGTPPQRYEPDHIRMPTLS